MGTGWGVHASSCWAEWPDLHNEIVETGSLNGCNRYSSAAITFMCAQISSLDQQQRGLQLVRQAQ